jgi:hypothetical protein
MYGPWKPGCSGKKYKDDYITPKIGTPNDSARIPMKKQSDLEPRPKVSLDEIHNISNIPYNRIGNPHFPYATPITFKVGNPYILYKSKKEDLISKQVWEENITAVSEDYIRRQALGIGYNYLF